MRILFEVAKQRTAGPAIFVDRDGVINRRRPDDYVLNWSQFIFMPGMREALRELSTLKLPMVVISNQAAVGKGLMDASGLEEITRRLHEVLSAEGITFAAYYYCIHRSDDGCDCRKPRPGLLFESALDFNITLTRSIFIGDSESDVKAARSAGCEPILFLSDVGHSPSLIDGTPEPAVASTAENLYRVAADCLAALSGGANE